jgi:hypothetical protein
MTVSSLRRLVSVGGELAAGILQVSRMAVSPPFIKAGKRQIISEKTADSGAGQRKCDVRCIWVMLYVIENPVVFLFSARARMACSRASRIG